MRPALLALLLGCTVSPGGPATPGSPSAEAAAGAAKIAEQAAAVEALAATLESEVDEGRRRIEAGTSTAPAEIERYRSYVAQIEAADAALQQSVKAWEASLPVAAGAPQPPPPRDVPPAAPPPKAGAPAPAPVSPSAGGGIHIDDPASALQGAPVQP